MIGVPTRTRCNRFPEIVSNKPIFYNLELNRLHYLPLRTQIHARRMPLIPDYSDEALLREIRTGTQLDRPLNFMYSRFFRPLAQHIEQNNGNSQDAEDIFQETILTFIELVKQDKFRGESSVKTFLFSVNRNIWMNELKKRGRLSRHYANFAIGQDNSDPTVEKFISKREARRQVMEFIQQLGPTCEEILLSFYYEKLSMAEILSRLKYQNEQVVRNRKAKCMKTLEQKLAADPQTARTFKEALQYE